MTAPAPPVLPLLAAPRAVSWEDLPRGQAIKVFRRLGQVLAVVSTAWLLVNIWGATPDLSPGGVDGVALADERQPGFTRVLALWVFCGVGWTAFLIATVVHRRAMQRLEAHRHGRVVWVSTREADLGRPKWVPVTHSSYASPIQIPLDSSRRRMWLTHALRDGSRIWLPVLVTATGLQAWLLHTPPYERAL
ncbi:MAG: hypothetical protein ACON5B_11185 [Myxococcota bacterium]